MLGIPFGVFLLILTLLMVAASARDHNLWEVTSALAFFALLYVAGLYDTGASLLLCVLVFACFSGAGLSTFSAQRHLEEMQRLRRLRVADARARGRCPKYPKCHRKGARCQSCADEHWNQMVGSKHGVRL